MQLYMNYNNTLHLFGLGSFKTRQSAIYCAHISQHMYYLFIYIILDEHSAFIAIILFSILSLYFAFCHFLQF